MKTPHSILKAVLCLGAAAIGLFTGAANAGVTDKFIYGDSVSIAGGTASTWARVNAAGKAIWVGMTIPLSMVEHPPAPGPGPAGAIAVLNFPAVVQQTTYFNHAEIHYNHHGHPSHPAYADPHRYAAAHFDFHFYSIPVAQVWTIPLVPPSPSLPAVSPDKLPAGYGQPAFSVPQMGRHASPLSEYSATDVWLSTTPAGFLPDASYMHFIEPMITRGFLLQRKSFTLAVPAPEVLGRATRFPAGCVVQYDKDADSYHVIYKGFEFMEYVCSRPVLMGFTSTGLLSGRTFPERCGGSL